MTRIDYHASHVNLYYRSINDIVTPNEIRLINFITTSVSALQMFIVLFAHCAFVHIAGFRAQLKYEARDEAKVDFAK